MSPELPDTLFFKSNADAFEYACKYLDNSLDDERPVLGYVLAVKGDKAIVKFANDVRPEIPTGDVENILNLADAETIAYGAPKVDHVPSLKRGDLVMIVATREAMAFGKPGFAAVIVEKVKPHYVLSLGGWQMHRSEQ